jgi:hypothetical protein
MSGHTVREVVFDLFRSFGMPTIFGNPGSTELPMFRDLPADFRYVRQMELRAGTGRGCPSRHRTRLLHRDAAARKAAGIPAPFQQTPRLVRAHHQRYLLRLTDVIDLGGQIQSPQCHAEQEPQPGHDAIADAEADAADAVPGSLLTLCWRRWDSNPRSPGAKE